MGPCRRWCTWDRVGGGVHRTVLEVVYLGPCRTHNGVRGL